MDLEIETNLVINRHIKLRVADGTLLAGLLLVYECEEPYVLVLTITPDLQTFLTEDDIIRVDVFKDDLSRELKHWLEGECRLLNSGMFFVNSFRPKLYVLLLFIPHPHIMAYHIVRIF
jgi:hypothetical protein